VDNHAPGVEVNILLAQGEQLAETQTGVGGETEQLGILGVLPRSPRDLAGVKVRRLWATMPAVGGCARKGLDLLGLVEVEHRRRRLAALGRRLDQVGRQPVGVGTARVVEDRREQLRSSGQLYIQLFATIAMQAPYVLTAVGGFFAGAAETLQETDYTDACPIATVALEVASTSEPLREATAEVFESWIAGATEYFAAAGISRDKARELALSMLSLLEGAFIFCRAMHTVEPLQVAGASAVALVQAALVDSATSRDRHI
jgi:hypothetical protein